MVRPVPCRDIVWWLHRKADGRLSDDEAASLTQHLSSCAACAAQAAALQWISQRLEIGRKPLPSGFADRVLRRLPKQTPNVLAPPPRRVPALWLLMPLAAGMILVLGLSLGAGWAWLTTARRSEPPRMQVELEWADVHAHTAAVAGDFNGWAASPMKKGADGVWRIRLSLPPGRYQYSFVVDGEKWVADPHAATVVDSAYGSPDSVLEVSL